MAEHLFGILGPLHVRGDDELEIVFSSKQQAVLAVLLLNANTIVSIERLTTALWESPPVSAVSNIHNYIARIRKVLSPRICLLTKGSGYLLKATPEEVDLLLFDQDVRRARAEMKRGDLTAAVRSFEGALLLCRGSPFEGIQFSSMMLAQVAGLEERIRDARLDWAEAKLGVGSSGEVIGELRSFLVEQPLCERAWQLLMLAYARTGQRDKALQAYQQGRTQLVELLGIEPGKELQQLQMAILSGDSSAASPEPRNVICQLPPDDAEFVGRCEELRAVTSSLLSIRPTDISVPICVISGQGGVGKTTLAVHLAHRTRHAFPHGQLYIDMRGGEKHHLEPGEALGRFLRALGVDSSAMPSGVDERCELYREKLADRRYLVVLDNVVDEKQIRALIPSTGGCAVLITSRHRLTALSAAQLIDLAVPPVDDAVEMLKRIIGPKMAAEAPDEAREVVQLCGRLPLAVRIAGAKLAARPYLTLSQLIARLSDTRSRLSQLSHGAWEVRACIAVSYQGLPPQAQQMFNRLGLLEAPDFAVWVGAALLDVSEHVAERLIEQLADVRLLEFAGSSPDGQGRFRFHDLTRAYAQECAEFVDAEIERTTALERVLSGWLAMTKGAHARLCGGDYRVIHGREVRWHLPPMIVDRAAQNPLAWIDVERAGIVAAVRQSAALGFDELCWDLAISSLNLFETRSLYDEWRSTHETALSCARLAGNHRGESALLNGLAGLHLALDESSRSREFLDDSLQLSAEVEDWHGHALALVNLAEVHRLQGEYADALICYDLAKQSLADAGDHGSEIAVLRGIGQVHFNQGRHATARHYIEQVVERAGSVGDVRSREFARVLLGEIQLVQGDLMAAEQTFNQALGYLGDLGFPRGSAYASLCLASAKLPQRLFEDAEHLLNNALNTYRSVNERLGQARVLYVWAELYRLQLQFNEAAVTLRAVAAICQEIPAPRRQYLALRSLGEVLHEAQDNVSAVRAWQQALTVFDGISAEDRAEISALIERHSNQEDAF